MRSLITHFGCLPANQPDPTECNQSVTVDHVTFISQSFTQGCSDGLIAIVSLIDCNARLKLEEKKKWTWIAICRFGCQAYGICLQRLKNSSLSNRKRQCKAGRWWWMAWMKNRDMWPCLCCVCFDVFILSYCSSLLHSHTTDCRHPHTHTHQHKHKLACRDTQAHKELCATGGVGVIVSYRWWQRGHMPIYFWGFWHCN